MGTVNYAHKFSAPIRVILNEESMRLFSSGEECVFRGKLFSADGTALLATTISIEDHCTLVSECEIKNAGKICEYHYFDGTWEDVDEIKIASTNVSGIAVFLRKNTVSFFLSLDFPEPRCTPPRQTDGPEHTSAGR